MFVWIFRILKALQMYKTSQNISQMVLQTSMFSMYKIIGSWVLQHWNVIVKK